MKHSNAFAQSNDIAINFLKSLLCELDSKTEEQDFFFIKLMHQIEVFCRGQEEDLLDYTMNLSTELPYLFPDLDNQACLDICTTIEGIFDYIEEYKLHSFADFEQHLFQKKQKAMECLNHHFAAKESIPNSSLYRPKTMRI